MTARTDHERAEFEKWLGIKPCGAAHDFGWAAWQARAALSATPAAAPVIPSELIEAVDAWFAQNTGLGGCSDKDVAELAAIFAAAAPVTLPEPWGYLVEGRIFIGRLLPQHVSSMVDAEGFEPTKLYTEPQMRALLATGGQAQAEHIKALIEVSRMPNQEHVADAHNAAVRHLRAIAAAKEQE